MRQTNVTITQKSSFDMTGICLPSSFVCLYLHHSGNKGAVGVSFMFNDTSFGFVNSHLTSGSEKKIR